MRFREFLAYRVGQVNGVAFRGCEKTETIILPDALIDLVAQLCGQLQPFFSQVIACWGSPSVFSSRKNPPASSARSNMVSVLGSTRAVGSILPPGVLAVPVE